MIIEKRTMNWLPQKSLYQEMQEARLKRREHIQKGLEVSASLAGSFQTARNGVAQGQVDLAIKIAHSRLLNRTA